MLQSITRNRPPDSVGEVSRAGHELNSASQLFTFDRNPILEAYTSTKPLTMNRSYPPDHPAPEKNLLLISCIDLRLTDDLVRFMDHENLTNRYDHVILAGASLGVSLGHELKKWSATDSYQFEAWWQVLKEHIGIAVALHYIEDVYVVEHEGCGAYKNFVRPEYLEAGEVECQKESAWLLARRIAGLEFPSPYKKAKSDTYHLRVQCFRIDLRGSVSLLPKPEGKVPKQA
jgi:hypothetical protein